MTEELRFHIEQYTEDVATLAAAVGIIGVVSLVACLVPSQRATRISPVEALADL
jgi:ABC-type lipoprotein release transport system permease subunit